MSICIYLIFLLFFCQTPWKTAMLTPMTNRVMNVTYHHDNDLIMFLQYSPMGISSTFILPIISPFSIDGNIDEKHQVPRIPTVQVCYPFFSNPLHQSLSPLIYLNVLYIKLFFHAQPIFF